MITIRQLKRALTEMRFNDIDEFVRKCVFYAEGDKKIPIEIIEDVGLSMMRRASLKILLDKLGYGI